MAKISIRNAKFWAYHGVFDYEKELGNEFEIDIEMHCGLEELGDSDDLGKTVDYLSVYKLAERIFCGGKFNLIETAARKICDAVLNEFKLVDSIVVRIRKPNAPLGIIDSVEIEYSAGRN